MYRSTKLPLSSLRGSPGLSSPELSLLGSKNLLSGTQSQHQKEVSPPPATPAFPTTLKRRRREGDVDSDDEDLPNRYGVTLEKKQCLRGESGAHDHGAGSERGLGKVRIAPYKEHEKVSVRSHRVSGLSDEESEDMNKSIPRTLESPKLSDEDDFLFDLEDYQFPNGTANGPKAIDQEPSSGGPAQQRIREEDSVDDDAEVEEESINSDRDGNPAEFKAKENKPVTRKGFHTTAGLLEKLFENTKGSIMTKETVAKAKQHLARLVELFRGTKSSKEIFIPLPEYTPEMKKLVVGAANDLRDWLSDIAKDLEGSIWRLWTPTSQGKIEDWDKGMKAKAAKPMNTVAQRAHEVESHANFRYRRATTFLSFTLALWYLWVEHLDHYVKRSAPKNRTVWLTQVNINARKQRGWPILNALAELNHYDINYDRRFCSIYQNEWLLPFMVHPEEIVWNWKVTDIEQWMEDNNTTSILQWEKMVGDPAFQVHDQARKEGKNFKERRKAVNDFLQDKMKYACLIEFESSYEAHK